MCSIGTPNWSASICANVVSLPWPCGDAPVVALIRPSRSMVTCECSQPPVGSDERRAEAADLDVHRQPEADQPALLRARRRARPSGAFQLAAFSARSSAFS